MQGWGAPPPVFEGQGFTCAHISSNSYALTVHALLNECLLL
jgi:hypothetical protein